MGNAIPYKIYRSSVDRPVGVFGRVLAKFKDCDVAFGSEIGFPDQ